jgi:predicted AAA+ superfamily ATPase
MPVMYRKALEKLIGWRDKTKRKPLILRGARQTGKTWLLEHFAQEHYRSYVRVAFDKDRQAQRIFAPDLNPARIIRELEDFSGQKIDPENTLVILDEIQDCPSALASLKYFCEEAPEYQLVCAGSFLGIALHEGTSFPVGKVELLTLYPLSFVEFLVALGEEALADRLSDGKVEVLRLHAESYISLLKKYFYVGGMPEAVAAYAKLGSLAEARQIQQGLLAMYDQDFSKHAPIVHVPKIRALWSSIPEQLAKENKKFIYAEVAKSARAREYAIAMMWLIDTGILYKVNRVSAVRHPLRSYADEKAFKLYSLDIGLLSCMSELDKDVLFEGDRAFVEFKGALSEQFVLNQLIAECGYEPFYWGNDTGSTEVDFLIQAGRRAIPIEVKSSVNLRSKSLYQYIEKNDPDIAVRTSLSDFHRGAVLIDLPVYAISVLPGLLGSAE